MPEIYSTPRSVPMMYKPEYLFRQPLSSDRAEQLATVSILAGELLSTVSLLLAVGGHGQSELLRFSSVLRKAERNLAAAADAA